MSTKSAGSQMPAYTEAVKSGLYAKRSGLVGKYDNVRRYWEDEITREALRPHLQRLIDTCRDEMRRISILDLGCGSADGYELLKGIVRRHPNLHDTEVDLLTPDILGRYKGLDLNKELLEQAEQVHGGNPKVQFEQGDFTQGLRALGDGELYDLYFSSYGTCSHHNDDETLIQLLAEIAERTQERSLIVCDWLGRYSYEWQDLWTHDLAETRNMDYVVSYIYDESEREERRDDMQHLNLRLVGRQEAEEIVAKASERAGVPIKALNFFDRSIFTGRHMDTAEYNPYAQPIRMAVNSLHEPNQRTDPSTLIIDYAPKKGFDFLNAHFEELQMCWNTLVQYAMQIFDLYDEEKDCFASEPPAPPPSSPRPLREMMQRMRQVVERVGPLDIALARENIIEPQLGYALRYLVSRLQQGRGCAHGLVGIFEVDKREAGA